MRQHAFAAPLLLAASLAAGCNGSSATDGGTADSGAPPDLVPLRCNGTFTNAIFASFLCDVRMYPLVDDNTMRFIPGAYQVPPGQMQPLEIALQLVVAPDFKAQHYTRDMFADGTILKYKGGNQTIFGAGKNTEIVPGEPLTTTGTIDLTLTSLPQNPGNGMDSWIDTNTHGSLTAQLPLGANQPGRPGDSVNLALEF